MAQRLPAALMIRLAVALAVAAVAVQCGTAQTTSAACVPSINSLTPCLSFTKGDASVPLPSCCAALANVLESAPRCLCAVLAGGAASLGYNVNTSRAVLVPAACNIETPPVSRCNAVGFPVPSHSGVPTPATSATPKAAAGDPSTTLPRLPVSGTTAGSQTSPPTNASAASDAGVAKSSAAISISFLAAVVSFVGF